jgi:putative hydrolase of the HAD superfamily
LQNYLNPKIRMNLKHYKHLFFDLDKTLWDLKTNSFETLKEIYSKHLQPIINGNNFDVFLKIYEFNNNNLWDSYRKGTVKKEELRIERFAITLKELGIKSNELANNMADDYLKLSPLKTNLFPYAKETLEFLYTKYKLHIITNGFKEVQLPKLKHTGLIKYFTEIILSEDVGYMKPDKNIFAYALEKSDALAEESLMIGDDYDVDIIGAQAVGMDQVLFSPENIFSNENVTYKISSLSELKEILK